jgi:soluble lytic murein transglycosylase-like protein
MAGVRGRSHATPVLLGALVLAAAAAMMLHEASRPASWQRPGVYAASLTSSALTAVPPAERPLIYDFRLPSLPPADAGTGTYRAMLRSAASRHALSADLVEAVAQVESDFDPRSVSSKGALGIMQLIPETAERFGVMRHELHDPERNIAAGTAYLAWLRDRYHGDLDRMLAAYNAGEGAVDKYGGIPPYRETQQYVRKVRAALGGGQ